MESKTESGAEVDGDKQIKPNNNLIDINDPKVSELLHQLAREHAYQIGYNDNNDMVQENWIIMMEAIPYYDLNKGPLEHYLRRCISNRQINLHGKINKNVRPPKEDTEQEKFRYQMDLQARNDLTTSRESDFEQAIENEDYIAKEEHERVVKETLPFNIRAIVEEAQGGQSLTKAQMNDLKRYINEQKQNRSTEA
jgi:DNA-directed RNA polymerase specialized sigma24 family protein